MRSPSAALAVAKHLSDTGYQFPEGFCLGACKTYFDAIRNGGSAASNWNDCPPVYKHTTFPPPGGYLPVWVGGGHGFGHICISAGSGWCYSTDFGPNGFVGDGRVRLITIDSIHRNDNALRYVGWMNWLHDPLPAPTPAHQFQWYVTDKTAGQIIYYAPGVKEHTYELGTRFVTI